MKIAIAVIGEKAFGRTIRSVESKIQTPHDLYVVGIGVNNRFITHQVPVGTSFEAACRTLLSVIREVLYDWYLFIASGEEVVSDIVSESLASSDSMDMRFLLDGMRACLVPVSIVYGVGREPNRFLFPPLAVEWPSLVGEIFVNQSDVFGPTGPFRLCKYCLSLRNGVEGIEKHTHLIHGDSYA